MQYPHEDRSQNPHPESLDMGLVKLSRFALIPSRPEKRRSEAVCCSIAVISSFTEGDVLVPSSFSSARIVSRYSFCASAKSSKFSAIIVVRALTMLLPVSWSRMVYAVIIFYFLSYKHIVFINRYTLILLQASCKIGRDLSCYSQTGKKKTHYCVFCIF